MKRSLIVDVSLRLVVYSALVLALYLLAAGHNQPGGGFVGGLVASAAVGVTFVAGGLDQVRSLLPVRPWTVLGAGLLVSVIGAIVPLLGGGGVLEQGFHELDVAVLGKVKVTSALFFDTGVFLLVVGVVLMALEALGEEERPEAES